MYDKITYEIIGSCYEVSNQLGGGYPEADYVIALCYELKAKGYSAIREFRTDFVYKDKTLKKKRIDLMVNDEVVVEVKVHSAFNHSHVQQLVGYLKQTKKKKGLLIYFNQAGVIVKHVAN